MRVDRHFYLITGLSLGLELFEKFLEIKSAQITMPGRSVSAKLVCHIQHLNAHICLVVTTESKSHKDHNMYDKYGQKHFAILFEEDKADTEKAIKITDAISGILSVLSSWKATEDLGVLQLSERCLGDGLLDIKMKKILEEIRATNSIHSEEEADLIIDIGTYTMLSNDITEKCFLYLPVVAASPELFDACHFYRESVSDFHFLGDRISEVVQESEPSEVVQEPERKELQVKAETAVHSAYKSVEAIVGEPGGNEQKNLERFRAWGIDPNKLVGFGSTKVSILSKFLSLQKLRDSAAAHGKKSRGKPITYYEIMDAQYLAQTIILEVISHKKSLSEKR